MNDQLIKIYSTFPSLSCAPLTQRSQLFMNSHLNHSMLTFMNSQDIFMTYFDRLQIHSGLSMKEQLGSCRGKKFRWTKPNESEVYRFLAILPKNQNKKPSKA